MYCFVTISYRLYRTRDGKVIKKDRIANMGVFDVLMHVPPGCYYYVGSM
jgi:hypothetical protein